MKGIVPRTNLNHLTQLCMLLKAILPEIDLETYDPQVRAYVLLYLTLHFLTLCFHAPKQDFIQYSV